MTNCRRVIDGEGTEMACKRVAVYQGYCRSCAWVMLPLERSLIPEQTKKPREHSNPLETPWARRVFEPFTKWFTRSAWPVGSVLLRRNSNGMFDLPSGRGKMPYGLGRGTADYVGFRSLIITPEMCGQKIAQFVSVEAKRVGKDLQPRQQRWFEIVEENGGLALRASPDNKQEVLAALTSTARPLR